MKRKGKRRSKILLPSVFVSFCSAGICFFQGKISFLKAIFGNIKYKDKQKETTALLIEM